MLREMARETDQRIHDGEHARHERIAWIEAGLAQAFFLDVPPVPPRHALREAVHLLEREPERLADIAHRALRAIGDDGGGERRAVAAVFFVEVLDHFLAPLVLEVDVDVGRLVALAGDEALEQHRHARGIDLGDAEGVAHGGVRGRPATLAEDVARAGELDHVVHGEEEGFIAQLLDEGELVLDEGANVRGRCAREAPPQTFVRESTQIRDRRHARRHDFIWILVAQLVEGKRAALGDLHRLGEERGRIELGENFPLAQMPLAVGMQRVAGLGHGGLQPDRGHHVLQCTSAAHMHVDIARRGERQTGLLAKGDEARELLAVVRAGEPFHRDPCPVGKAVREPAGFGQGRGKGEGRRDEQRQTPRHAARKIVLRQSIFTLVRSAPRSRDEIGKIAVTRAVGGEQHQSG